MKVEIHMKIILLIRKELGDFDKKLLDKPEVIIANKMDMESAKKI